MWKYCCDPTSRVAIAAPRGHAKSTAVTLAFVLCSIALKVKQHVLVISSNEDMASDFIGDIKTELIENEELRQFIGFRGFTKDSESEIVGEFQDGSKFRVIAKGAGQRMRGTKWNHKRPDLVVVDDVEDDEIVLNEERRKKFKRWFYGAVRSILAEGGQIRIVGTILHLDSLLENLMPSFDGKDTITEPLKVWSKGFVKGRWLSVKFRAHDITYDHILWPNKFSKESLIELKDEFMAQGLLDLYNQEYLNDPIDDSVAYFKEIYFRDPPKDENWARRSRKHYASCDLAISQRDSANYSTIVVTALDDLGRLEFVHARRGRWDSMEIIENLFEIQKLYQPELFAIERGHIEKTLGPFLNAEMRVRGRYINFEGFQPVDDKTVRARSIQGRMKIGDVFFQKENDWYEEFHDELRKFPKGRNDDYVDATAYIGLLLDKMVNPPSQDELDQEELEEDYQKHNTLGRNRITGY